MWLHVDSFYETVVSAWSVASHMSGGCWSDKVFQCGRILGKWGAHTFKAIHKRLRWLLKRLKRLRSMTQTVAIIDEKGRVEAEIRDIRKKLETEAWQ